MAKPWDLSLEVDEVVDLVHASGLWPAIRYAQTEYDSVTASAFTERFYPEMYTFHFAFGEMTITPKDAKKILHLSVTGKSVTENFVDPMPWEDLYQLVESTLGWDKETTELEFCRAAKDVDDLSHGMGQEPKKLKSIKLTNLKKEFENTKQKVKEGKLVMDENKVKYTARAYLLYTLGRLIFPDLTGNKVNAHYLQLLTDLNTVHQYSWGTAAVSYLLEQLAKASRLQSTQIGGNFSLLQVWVYDHFPQLNLAKIDTNWVNTKPTSAKYSFEHNKKKGKSESLIKLREKLDSLNAKDVVFEPYFDDECQDDQHAPVSFYYGPLFHPGGFSLYDPRRVLRQISYIQTVPKEKDEKFKSLVAGTKNTYGFFKPQYDPEPSLDHWNNSKENQIATTHVTPLGDYRCQHSDNYMDWYNQISHPLVINKEALSHAEAKRLAEKATETEKTKKSAPGIQDASKAYDITVKEGRQLSKKMMRRIKCNKPLTVVEQKILYDRWKAIITKGKIYLEKTLMERVTKRTRQEGEGTSRGATTGEEAETDEEQQSEVGSRRGEKRCRGK
ncbi:protein MAINTENANCE OF MERISTEMS-like [Papaver somniferum]|uniref:protein MAINTENANCE OF MERISTEMS-like n=1 Tax=Papaver somniferum TaxID=3469 RepID=UPI000E7048BE|nr:protein MAINTENANCE OF MERISTEMS-like [Papaver somniferum]XP_026387973.1 protein MAINTENANCE OF MERISTEMS-like [Papaver somniferum]XP_026387974.1 protein MAINTENANCE OF MERISTEMS-like [Papaver somniferum]XP_026387975.1 protein MAINTENANCE OF MERISTEMS-like [Papaver somniferum]